MSISLNRLQKHRGNNGVYVLLKDNIIVYIGHSRDCYTRILEHLVEGKKQFNDVMSKDFSLLRSEDIKILEMGMICHFKPKYNFLKFDSFDLWVYSLPQKNKTTDRYKQLVSESILLLNKALLEKESD